MAEQSLLPSIVAVSSPCPAFGTNSTVKFWLQRSSLEQQPTLYSCSRIFDAKQTSGRSFGSIRSLSRHLCEKNGSHKHVYARDYKDIILRVRFCVKHGGAFKYIFSSESFIFVFSQKHYSTPVSSLANTSTLVTVGECSNKSLVTWNALYQESQSTKTCTNERAICRYGVKDCDLIMDYFCNGILGTEKASR